MNKSIMDIIGKVKIWFERGRMWISIVQFMMIVYLTTLDIKGDVTMLIAVLIFSWIVVTTLDMMFLLPAENKTLWEYNPAFVEIRKDVREVKGMLKEMRKNDE